MTELKTIPVDVRFFEEARFTQVVWLGMAGALISARGRILLIDPLLVQVEKGDRLYSEVGCPLRLPLPIQAQEVPRADFVLYTHADDDHFGQQTALALAERTACQFAAPPPVYRALRELGVDPSRLILAEEGLRLPLEDSEVQVTPALHDWQSVNPWRREDCCGYLVKTPDGTIWHPGDTRLIDDLLEVKGVDVLFFDVAAVDAHLGPQGSAELAKSCGAKVLIAYHYGTFDLPTEPYASSDPRDALPYLEGVPGKYLLLNPGEVLRLPLSSASQGGPA